MIVRPINHETIWPSLEGVVPLGQRTYAMLHLDMLIVHPPLTPTKRWLSINLDDVLLFMWLLSLTILCSFSGAIVFCSLISSDYESLSDMECFLAHL